MLEENKWMDEESKNSAIEKAKSIEPRVGFPNYYNHPDYIVNNFKVSYYDF